MGRRPKTGFIAIALVCTIILLVLIFTFSGKQYSVLQPAGLIAQKQQTLLVITVLLSLIVVIPVFFMTFYFAYKYRESNDKSVYKPDFDHSKIAETIWWGVPTILIIILSVVTFRSSHDLDPFKPLEASAQPLKIQVVAMQWKWLFIYPDYQIATVNYVQIPEDVPINFEITSDAPMNSFWVPQLGGQVYAMSGMTTKLHLIAEQAGTYKGSSANISGQGFSNMRFSVNAIAAGSFNEWVNDVQRESQSLDKNTYDELAKPAIFKVNNQFALKEDQLFSQIIRKYMPNEKPYGNNHNSMHGGGQ